MLSFKIHADLELSFLTHQIMLMFIDMYIFLIEDFMILPSKNDIW